MGTWGDGLYDNDGALDVLGQLVGIEAEERDVVRMAARIGLLVWLDPTGMTHDDGALQQRVAELGPLDALPEATRTTLVALVADPEAMIKRQDAWRDAKVEAVLGGYADGPRIDALLRFPGAAAVVAELGERVAARLDKLLRTGVDLYEVAGDMAALGVAIALKEAGLWAPDTTRVAGWRAGFDAIDKATRSERKFWVKYVRRVREGFGLLGPGPAPVAPAKPVVRKRSTRKEPTPSGPVMRFSHAKFGPGTLVARTGAGDAEALELRFDDGVVRKILRRFVAAIEA